jgi:adenylate kinase
MTKRLLNRGKSSGRVDDNEDTIKLRLNTFHQVTKPVIDHYEALNKLKIVNSEQDPDDVFEDVKKILENKEGENYMHFKRKIICKNIILVIF